MHEQIDYIVKSIGRKLSDYDYLRQVSNEESNYLETESGLINPFQELSLSHGLPSLCMLYGEMNEHYPEEGWDRIGHQYMQRIGQQLEEEGVQSLSMFTGAAGIGLSALCISKQRRRYSSFISSINELIANSIDPLLEQIQSRQDLYMQDYDPISGVTGVAAYTLLFHNDSNFPVMKEINRKIVNYIIHVCQDKECNGKLVPGWYISAANQFSEVDKLRWPNGCFNIGLAHGIPSLLITLCDSYLKGIKEEGQLDSIRKLADFLLQSRIESEGQYYWGTHISIEEYNDLTVTSTYTRDAWCYGTPGVAYSLLAAGKALQDDKYLTPAVESMKRAAVRQQEIYCPTFCHGLSNLAMISKHFYSVTKDAEFLQITSSLTEQMMSYYNEELPFGFQTVDKKTGIEKLYDYVGLIDGVTGVALTLLAVNKDKKTPWDSAFLLGGLSDEEHTRC
ncbi:Nisin biosynthesis protein NisC [compost metagenome]